ncbi:hypothetical protein CJ235_08125 [Staphylococcus pettenkoferi]|uniref:Uncharacterized protein n=1 Tax=Staphylococcus pettenkoferi TaxID=170573 RepID=A0A2N6QFS6_9STAP|nr:hypothetical protein CJ235_08125 [Staphylococcus pettenkoferi]
MNPDLYCASVTYKSNTYDKPIFNLVKFLAWTEIYDFVVLPPQRELGFIRVLNLMNPDLYCASVTYKSNTYDKPIFNLVKFLAWTEIGYFVLLFPAKKARLHESVKPYEVRQLLCN